MNDNGGSQPAIHENHQQDNSQSPPSHDNQLHQYPSHQDQLEHRHTHTPNSYVNFHSPGLPIPKSKTPASSTKRLDHQPLMLSSPSPAHKIPGSNARNELYLKSVLSSPYQHKSYTPTSATPCGVSPAFKTPIRSARNSPGNLCSTPQGTRPPIPANATPQRRKIKNPFDHELLDGLHGPMFMSPGVFSIASTPASDEKKPFRWSIEHIAELNPADIEEMPVHQDAHLLPDKEAEERAQLAIDKFFSNHLIAPSPWSADSKKVMKTPASNTGSGSRLPNMNLEEELQGSIQKQLPSKSFSTQEVGCQTTLSLPMDFDIAKVLGAYMNQSTSEDNNADILSTSSLRRKLFFQGDTSSVAPSPVRRGNLDDSLSADVLAASPQVSPVNQQLQSWEQATPLKTPSRNQFSSSPIKNVKGLKTPQFHTPPGSDFFDSPELSPIVRGHLRRTRSSGLFVPHDGSFFSEDGSGETKPIAEKPLISPEVSPIKAEFMRTPGSEERSKHSLQDPGISPIHAHSVHRHSDDEGSFIQEHQGFTSSDDSDHDMTTPMPAFHTEKRRPGSTRKISHLTRHRQRNILPEMEDTAMDFETVPTDKNIRFADDIKTSSLLITRDLSFVDMECTSENTAAPNSTNQDTGYHTASLQSTTQDTGLHTNLTTQFSSLPFNTTNPDLIYNNAPITSVHQDIVSYSTNQINSMPITAESSLQNFKALNDSAISHDEYVPEEDREEKLVQQILEISRTEKCGNYGDMMSEEEILHRARQVLAMANSLYPDMKSEDNTGSKVKPRLIDHRRLNILNELEPIVSSTPHKSAKGMFTSVKLPTPVKSPSPSEQALAIIRRAGEDLARYSHVLDTVKS